MRKWIYLSLAVIIGVAAGILYLWNKPHRSIDDLQSRPVSAGLITSLFEKEEAFANKEYLNKALLVAGVVKDVSMNDNSQLVVLLEGSDEFTGVQCVFKNKPRAIHKGDTIRVAGFCNGYTTAVILDDCKLIK